MFDDFLDVIGFDGDDGEDMEIGASGDSWMDMDGDGIPDTMAADIDGDGIQETLLTDTDGDGLFDMAMMDMDGDGVFETAGFDNNGDGYFDEMIMDTDGDGQMDTAVSDMNGDGAVDALYMEQYADTDGDGAADTVFSQQQIDTDGDGQMDTVVTEVLSDSDNDGHLDYYSHTEETDTDGDGVIDHVVIAEDVNGDMEFDAVTEMEDWNGNGTWDSTEMVTFELAPAEAYNEYEHFDPAESDGSGIVGDPESALDTWHTQSGNTCAVVSQEGILESILGQEFDEDELRELAEDHGWYNNGTSAEDVGQLLEHYGIHTEQSSGNSIDDLRDSLEDGNQIIVMVDAEELWSGENEEMFGPGMDMDHAVRVIGIDESDPENPMVIINDSGVANGQGVMIPLDDFMDSWEDSGCSMVEAFPDDTI